MEWSSDSAMRTMWSEYPNPALTKNGDMMDFFKKHLQLAFDAGREAGHKAELAVEMAIFDRFVKR